MGVGEPQVTVLVGEPQVTVLAPLKSLEKTEVRRLVRTFLIRDLMSNSADRFQHDGLLHEIFW